MQRRIHHLFTMIELIIVILIIAILAAAAIPQFFNTADNADVVTLQSNLAVLRKSISLYYHQHNSTYPGAVKVDGTGAATAAADNPAAFVDQLSKYSDATGKTSATLNRSLYPYGPYLTNGIPVNPLNNKTIVEVLDEAAALDAADVTTGTASNAGWIYSKQSGEIRSCTATELGM